MRSPDGAEGEALDRHVLEGELDEEDESAEERPDGGSEKRGAQTHLHSHRDGDTDEDGDDEKEKADQLL